MTGLYLTHEALYQGNGISKKIIAQKRGLENNGVNMHLCYMQITGDIRSYVVDGRALFTLGRGILATIKYYSVFSPILDFVRENNISFVYIRYIHIATPFYIHFLKKLKRMGVLIFMEIPTYPYDAEHIGDNWKQRIISFFERLSRNQFREYVHKIVTVQEYDVIFGIPTIKISNGIDFNSIPLRNPISHQGYNFLGVANMKDWHGYDRLIEGLGRYYDNGGQEDIHFFVVGDNSYVIDQYSELVKKYHLEERVHFEGSKHGEDLNWYFNKADLAIGCLGCHRKELTDAKPLKSVEYAARGIPFVYSENNYDFDNCPFVLKISQDESSVDVVKILEFSKNINMSPEKIRSYVGTSLTWESQMKKVLSCCK